MAHQTHVLLVVEGLESLQDVGSHWMFTMMNSAMLLRVDSNK